MEVSVGRIFMWRFNKGSTCLQTFQIIGNIHSLADVGMRSQILALLTVSQTLPSGPCHVVPSISTLQQSSLLVHSRAIFITSSLSLQEGREFTLVQNHPRGYLFWITQNQQIGGLYLITWVIWNSLTRSLKSIVFTATPSLIGRVSYWLCTPRDRDLGAIPECCLLQRSFIVSCH